MALFSKRVLRVPPAHAGIDLLLVVYTVANLGFPRTRGDRPVATRILSRPMSVPPHTRG